MARDQVFISYSHADRKWLDRLYTQLKPSVRAGAIDIWDDRRIRDGARWQDEIAAALARARVAVLLVTPDFLASDFIAQRELPAILSAAGAEGLTVLWIAIKHSAFHDTEIATYHAVNDPARPLSIMHHAHVDRELVRICSRVKEVFGEPTTAMSAALAPPERPSMHGSLPDARVDGTVQALSSRQSTDVERERLTQVLEGARARRRELTVLGADVAGVSEEILAIKRQLRDGGRLRQGDSLGDGRYLLLEIMGKGGFATVWEAQDRVETRRVAVKVLHAELAGDPVRRDRFLRGARIMKELAHDGIVPILDPDGEDDGFHYIVMELMPGGDLRKRALRRQFGAAEGLALIGQVGHALAAAHSRGFVHRDVKPANILLDSDGLPKLTDFDLAGGYDTTGGTRTGALGTFLYAPPELMDRPQEATAAADVYGLAATAIFLLRGKDLPYEFVRNPTAVVAKLPCDAAIRAVLTRAIDLDPGARFPDAAAFCKALARSEGVANLAPLHGAGFGPVHDSKGAVFPIRFGSYVLAKPLERGEAGSRYLAVRGERDAPRACVIKTLADEWADKDHQHLPPYRDQARLLLRLTHRNLAPILDWGDVNGEQYLCTDFVEGKNLRSVWNRCARRGVAFPVEVATLIVRELALGLHHMHHVAEIGLIHRLVSPTHVLLSFRGGVMLSDLGLAIPPLTTAPQGIFYGTLKYMSPEQARGEPLDKRTDLFSSGIILWELLTGRQLNPTTRSFRDTESNTLSDEGQALLENIRTGASIVPPSGCASRVPPELDRIALKALAPRRDERYRTCAEFADDLNDFIVAHFPKMNERHIEDFLGTLYADDNMEAERVERKTLIAEAKMLLDAPHLPDDERHS